MVMRRTFEEPLRLHFKEVTDKYQSKGWGVSYPSVSLEKHPIASIIGGYGVFSEITGVLVGEPQPGGGGGW